MEATLAMSAARPGAPTAVSVTADFGAIVREYEGEVFGVALRMLGDRDAAADVTNTTFFKAYRGWRTYDPGRPLRRWLLGIAAHEAISAGRARSRELARLAPPEAAEAVADGGPAPHEMALTRERRERVRGAVARLPEVYRAPVVLRYFSDLTVEEVASALGRRPATVGVQLLRGRALLRAALSGEEVGW